MAESAASFVIAVKVKPRSALSRLEPDGTGGWVAHLKSPPVDGKANAELIALVARQFGCAKAAVSIKAGASARTKLVKVTAAAAQLGVGHKP